MRVKMNIHEGLERGLCGHCRWAQRITFTNDQQQFWCQVLHPMIEIKQPVKECNEYSVEGSMNRHEMEEKAWIIEVRKSGIASFVRPEDRKDKP